MNLQLNNDDLLHLNARDITIIVKAIDMIESQGNVNKVDLKKELLNLQSLHQRMKRDKKLFIAGLVADLEKSLKNYQRNGRY